MDRIGCNWHHLLYVLIGTVFLVRFILVFFLFFLRVLVLTVCLDTPCFFLLVILRSIRYVHVRIQYVRHLMCHLVHTTHLSYSHFRVFTLSVFHPFRPLNSLYLCGKKNQYADCRHGPWARWFEFMEIHRVNLKDRNKYRR